MSNSVPEETLEFAESLSLTQPLSVRPRWFRSTHTIKGNDAIMLALLIHIYPSIHQAVKCRTNPNTTHQWGVVMGLKRAEQMGDLRRHYPDRMQNGCSRCNDIHLPSTVCKALQQAWDVILRRQRELQRERKIQKQRERRAAEKAQREAPVPNTSMHIPARVEAEPGPVDIDRAATFSDMPFANSEEAELFADLKQVQRCQLEELHDKQAAEIARLRKEHVAEERRMIATHHKELAEMLAPPEQTHAFIRSKPVHRLPSPPSSSPVHSFVHSSTSLDAGPSRPSQRAQEILANIDWEVICHTPNPNKHKADEKGNDFKGKRLKVEIADDIIELSD
ncbi:hypothetical protein K435DRAFT_867527 [Dendrothele bispora CBS 962.96]|uniref:Uncharacterized protein n=1 Tax=Dendrothele bispora (strain CBS 962.96) TaxID=1314807 RepID=A0A4S8LE62_DENBC|nr:hypothetical protein K435DRAFT_867527 [Dendrothele bispora CBS 962.96]